MLSFPWSTIYGNKLLYQNDIFKIISIYATGNVIFCQDRKCRKKTNELFVMKSSMNIINTKYKRCGIKDCNQLLIYIL